MNQSNKEKGIKNPYQQEQPKAQLSDKTAKKVADFVHIMLKDKK